jgi:hypothetical protein
MVQRKEDMTFKKPIQNQDKNSDSSGESTGLAMLKEKDPEAINHLHFKEEAYFESVVDMEEWV